MKNIPYFWRDATNFPRNIHGLEHSDFKARKNGGGFVTTPPNLKTDYSFYVSAAGLMEYELLARTLHR